MIAAYIKSALIFAAANGILPCRLVEILIRHTPLRGA